MKQAPTVHRKSEQETSTHGSRASAVAGCVALLSLGNLLGCGDSQDATKTSSNKPTTQSQQPTTPPDKAKPKPKAQQPKPHSDQAKREAAAKRARSRAAASAKVTPGRDLPSRSGAVADPGRAVACLQKRGYGQTRTLTGRGASGSTTGVLVISGPARKPRIGATLLYFNSAAQAKRLTDTVSKARSRVTLPGAYQLVSRVVIQYPQTPRRKVSGDIEACIR